MNLAKKELFKYLAETGLHFRDFPWGNSVAYKNWLAQTYFFVRHTPRFLLLSANKWSETDKKAQESALIHLQGELDHDSLLLNDLKNLNATIDEFKELPETQAFYQTQYYWIEQVNPIAHLGYAYLLEGLASIEGPCAYMHVSLRHGLDAGTFLKTHTEEDSIHFQDGLNKLEDLTEEETKYFIQCLEQASFLYSQILARIIREAN